MRESSPAKPPPTSRNQGNAAPEKVKGSVARCVIARKCWSCGQGDHVARDCQRRRCWQCRRYGHMKKDCQEGRYRREFLLPAPLSASENKIIKDKARVCSMLFEKGELSCKAYVKAVRTNALIDTGAAVSLIRSEIVRKMKNRPALLEADLVISQADGSQMEIEGKIRCPIKVAGVQASHTLYVAPELCTELILGEDWLKARKACLEFEPAKLILGEIEVPLGKQEKDKLIVVAKEDIQIPPRKVVSCEGRLLNMEVEGEIRQVASVKNCEDSEEGITLCESVVQVKEIIPVLIANTSRVRRWDMPSPYVELIRYD